MSSSWLVDLYAGAFLSDGGSVLLRIDASGNRRWYLYDGLGSVLAEVDDNGSILCLPVYGGTRDESGSTDSKHHFCGSLGHADDDGAGLIYMRARWYDPWAGRFVSEDPEGNGSNWYAYCGNNPANSVDPSGRRSFDPVAALGAVISAFGGWIFTIRASLAPAVQNWCGSAANYLAAFVAMAAATEVPGVIIAVAEAVGAAVAAIAASPLLAVALICVAAAAVVYAGALIATSKPDSPSQPNTQPDDGLLWA